MAVFSPVLYSGSTVNIFRQPGVIVRKWLLRMWDDMGLLWRKHVLMSFVVEFVKSLFSVAAIESLILNGYQHTAVWIFGLNSVRFLFVGLDEERSLQKKGGYTRRIACSHFVICCLHNETWTSTETNNTRSFANELQGALR